MEAVRKAMASPTAKKLAAAFVVSAAGLLAIKQDEGSINRVYLDPVGIPTACVGHTATVSKSDVGKQITDAVCDELLRQDLSDASRAVQRHVKVPITQGQYDALVSFTFNVGAGNLNRSTLLRKLNAGDCFGAAAEFPRWNKAKGRVLRGLIKRRASEQAKFIRDCR